MRGVAIVAATLLAIGGAAPAALWLAASGAVYAARSPDRLLDALVICAFCGLALAFP